MYKYSSYNFWYIWTISKEEKRSRGVKSKFTQFTSKAWTFDPVQCLLHFVHMLYEFLLGDNMPVICMFPLEASQCILSKFETILSRITFHAWLLVSWWIKGERMHFSPMHSFGILKIAIYHKITHPPDNGPLKRVDIGFLVRLPASLLFS